MSLFALVDNETPRIRRIALTQSLQREVEELFRDQATRLLHDATIHDFDARHSPESDEILRIRDFADPDGCLKAADDPIRIPLMQITDDALQHLAGLFIGTTVGRRKSVCFQVFDRRRALTRGKFALIDVGQHLAKLDKSGLLLDTSVAAVLQGDDLLFKSFHTTSRLFDLSAQYHEATDQEIETFLDHKGISPPPSSAAFLTLADTQRIRKQIALILDSKILDRVQPKTIVTEARRVGLKVATRNVDGKPRIVLPDQRPELKNLLDFLQENYYQGCLTSTPFVSNSKRPA